MATAQTKTECPNQLIGTHRLAKHLVPTRQTLKTSCGAASFNTALLYFGFQSPGELAWAAHFGCEQQGGTWPWQITAAAKSLGLSALRSENLTPEHLARFLDDDEIVLLEWTTSTAHFSVLQELNYQSLRIMDPMADAGFREISWDDFYLVGLKSPFDSSTGRGYTN